jgi:hypothetical protein
MKRFRQNAFTRPARRALLAGSLLLLMAGCSYGSRRVEMPALSPEEAGKQALAEYDTNRDGFLDAKELERCPALKNSLAELDQNKDGKISAEEIAQRLAGFQATRIGLIAVPVRISLNGAPLAGATVTLKPEKFMGEAVKPASGISDEQGNVSLHVEGESASGTQWGFFRIEVSKKDAAGKELLPPRYNTSTTLGQEVAPNRRSMIILRLSTKS